MHEAVQFPRLLSSEIATAQTERRFHLNRPALTTNAIRQIMLADPVMRSRYRVPKDSPFVATEDEVIGAI